MGFSERQLEVFRLLAEGVNIPVIARRMGVSHNTVYRESRRIRKRLGARTAAHMVALGYQRGVLKLGD